MTTDAPRVPGRAEIQTWLRNPAVISGVVALVVTRVLVALTDRVPTVDGVSYIETGLNLFSGNGLTYRGSPQTHFPPGVPVLIGLVDQVIGDGHRALVVVTALSGIAIGLLLMALTGVIWGRVSAVIALWLAVVAPLLAIEIPVRGGGSEAPFVAAILAVLVVAVTAPSGRHSAWWGVGFGAGAGVAYLIRPEGMWICVGVLVVWLWQRRRRGLHALRFAFPAVAVLALVSAPYLGYLHARTGSWELSGKSDDVSIEAWRAVAENRRADRDTYLYELDRDTMSLVSKAKREPLLSLARQHPGEYARIVSINVGRMLATFLGPNSAHGSWPGWTLLSLPVLGAALVGMWSTRRDRSAQLLMVSAAIPLITALAFFFQARYAVLTATLCIPFAAVPLGRWWTKIRTSTDSRPWWKRPTVVAFVAFGAVCGYNLLAKSIGPDGLGGFKDPVEYADAGRWLRSNTDPSSKVMARSAIITYYAERDAVAMPAADPADIMAFARFNGAEYVVIDQYLLRTYRPRLMALLAPMDSREYRTAIADARLEPVYETIEDGRVTRVFQVLD